MLVTEQKKAYWEYQYRLGKEYIIPLLSDWGVSLSEKKVLDIGCAEGGVLCSFADLGVEGYGIELSSSRLLIAKEMARKHHIPTIHFIIADINRDYFEEIYTGIGLNDSPGPIEKIYPRAAQLALFAATVGPELVKTISDLFAKGDFAFANHLDAAASSGTDLISHVLEAQFKADLIRQGRANQQTVVMAYSPGYCGWHVSGQKRLFEFLRPERIGVSLRESFLMEPLKSVSGVLIAGLREIHQFAPTYYVCEQCTTRDCQERMRKLSEKSCCDRE